MAVTKRSFIIIMLIAAIRRILGKQSHAERIVFLSLGITFNFALGLIKSFLSRMKRGAGMRVEWSLPRELIYGGSREVLAWAGHLFERDPESIAAWTTISEWASYFPARYGLPSQGLNSTYFKANDVDCAAVFLKENEQSVLNRLKLGGESPEDEELIYILHGHGGGYVAGGIYAAQHTSAEIFRQKHKHKVSERIVFVHVDYTVGVDKKYPQAIVDFVSAFDFLVKKGVDSTRIYIMGESGGGGLAACTLLALRDNPDFLKRSSDFLKHQPAGGILLSPMMDLSHDYPYCSNVEKYDLINGKLANICAVNYVDKNNCQSPYATPVQAEDLSNLPPILLQTGASEIFDAPCKDFVDKCKVHGSHVQYEAYEGMVHCFQILGTMFRCQHAPRAIESILNFVHINSPEAMKKRS